MTDELRKYLIEQCRGWMLPEEIRSLARIGLTEHGEKVTREVAAKEEKIELMYGFKDDKTNQLVGMGRNKLELTIATNLLQRHEKEILNYCPKCNGLTRTPKSKQCRHCGFDWH